MSIAVLRKKTKFKNRIGARRTDYNYIGEPKLVGYRGFALNMSNRGSVTGSKFNNGKTFGIKATCGQCNTLAAANERQSNCASCNKSAVAKQVSYRNYLRRATEAVSKGKGTGLRAKVVTTKYPPGWADFTNKNLDTTGATAEDGGGAPLLNYYNEDIVAAGGINIFIPPNTGTGSDSPGLYASSITVTLENNQAAIQTVSLTLKHRNATPVVDFSTSFNIVIPAAAGGVDGVITQTISLVSTLPQQKSVGGINEIELSATTVGGAVSVLQMTSLTFTNVCVPRCYKSTWKRGPSFDSSSHIDNKKSAVVQCTQPVGSVATGCSYPNAVTEPKRNTCSVTLGKTSYTRMYNIPCNTAKKVLGVTASDQIARVKARRVCKASGTNSFTGESCSESYESNMMHDNQRKVC